MDSFVPVTDQDFPAVESFLREADLTVSGIDSPTVRLWTERDAHGSLRGCTGFELSDDGQHALIRSVAVHGSSRRAGAGTRLARFALERATDAGAHTAWLFSRRSGPFWQGLGFESADRHELVRCLPNTHQVRLFVESGRLDTEVAWSRALSPALD